ncbi:hypothetical protein TSUD_174340 [Trifolium subterraneum]|nr:hypothetical protein TSUD_174340 [Trifolium subterraneum]
MSATLHAATVTSENSHHSVFYAVKKILESHSARKNCHNYDCGGLIRGNRGERLGRFAKRLGACVMVAELWDAYEGLKLAWEKGYKHIELQMDAQSVVKALNGEMQIMAKGWSLCKRIRRLLELEWEVHIRHTYWEANMCADALPHVGRERDMGSTMTIYESCAAHLPHYVLDDASGTSVPKIIIL